MIRHEECVEAAAFQRLDEAYQMLEIEVGVGIGARYAPPRRVNADRAHERTEVELFGHARPFACIAPQIWTSVVTFQRPAFVPLVSEDVLSLKTAKAADFNVSRRRVRRGG